MAHDLTLSSSFVYISADRLAIQDLTLSPSFVYISADRLAIQRPWF